jgi:hypothetical protein
MLSPSLAEVMAAMSIAVDIGMGQPIEQGLGFASWLFASASWWALKGMSSRRSSGSYQGLGTLQTTLTRVQAAHAPCLPERVLSR